VLQVDDQKEEGVFAGKTFCEDASSRSTAERQETHRTEACEASHQLDVSDSMTAVCALWI
jgi:hypothetical protein